MDLAALVHAADPDALLRAVDDLAAAREWDGLVDLGRRCRAAVEVGRQLWGVALHVDYRLALEAPPPLAAAVLAPGTGRFTLGPLPEVAASRAPWAALAPHLTDPVTAAAVAAERVARGEDVAAAGHPLPPVELPPTPQPWEPAYAVATYRGRSASFPEPDLGPPPLPAVCRLRPGRRLPDDEAVAALRAVVETWTAESSGSVRAVVVEGDAAGAVGRLLADAQRPPRAALAPLSGSGALALLQWAGASGGALGRRRGGAAGRFAAWWAATMLAGLDWPCEPDDLGSGVGELSWWRWRADGPDGGWTLRLAVADPADGLAWAVDAVDASTPSRTRARDSMRA